MENRWNLSMLYTSEEEWQSALDSLPTRNQKVLQMLPPFWAEGDVEPFLRCGIGGLASEEIENVRRSLPEILQGMQEVARVAASCEVWLARVTDIYPEDPHLAELSDRLDRITLHENNTLRRVQGVLCRLPNLEEQVAADENLQEYLPFIRKLLRTPLAAESLSEELGGGLFRLNQAMRDAAIDFQGSPISFNTMKDISATYDWLDWPEEKEMITRQFYEAYGEQAGRILLEEVRRDEQDIRSIGRESAELALCAEGLSERTVEALLSAVDQALPILWECRELLRRSWRRREAQELITQEELMSGADEVWEEDLTESNPMGGGPSEENFMEDVLSDEEIDARNEAQYEELREQMLQCFADFEPAFRETITDCFDGGWIWIDDDEQAYANQSCARIYGSEHSYIHMSADMEYSGLAHELGHAWNNRLIAAENILIWKNSFLVEYPSMLAELWERMWSLDRLPERMKEWKEQLGEEHPLVQLYQTSPIAYEDLIYTFFANVFLACSEYRFERELRSRITCEELTVEDLSEMYCRYKEALLPLEEKESSANPMGWVKNVSLYDIRQYYNLPYAIACLLAMKTLAKYRGIMPEKRENFWARIRSLVLEMNCRPTDELLREHFEGDPETPEFWYEGMQLLQAILEPMRRIDTSL